MSKSKKSRGRASWEARGCLGPLRVGAFRRVAAVYKSTTEVGSDGFHMRVPLDLSNECCGRILMLLHEVEMAGVWPTNAGTTLFSLIP